MALHQSFQRASESRTPMKRLRRKAQNQLKNARQKSSPPKNDQENNNRDLNNNVKNENEKNGNENEKNGNENEKNENENENENQNQNMNENKKEIANLDEDEIESQKRSVRTGHSATRWFHIDMVIFTISGFLPGEYLLRVFPLICKSMKFRRFSISLLGPSTGMDRDDEDNLEASIVLSCNWKQILRMIETDHTLNALRMEYSPLLTQDFPHVETLVIPSRFSNSCESFCFDLFPRLTKLEVYIKATPVEELLGWIWHLKLVALTLHGSEQGDKRGGGLHPAIAHGPPFFAHTLRSLNVVNERFLTLLSPHCQSLQSLTTERYHPAIMGANPGLTSLTLAEDQRQDRGHDYPFLDLTRHTQLVELEVHGFRPILSSARHPKLSRVSFTEPHTTVSNFLWQCRALTHVSLRECSWRDVVSITKALNKRTKLTLSPSPMRTARPSLAEVKTFLLDRGFQVNGEFLLSTSDGQKQWRKVMEIAPQIREWALLKTDNLDPLFSGGDCGAFFSSFNTLNTIDLTVRAQWWHGCLLNIVQSCPLLRRLKVYGLEFSGDLKLHSPSLRTLNLKFNNGYSGFDLNLPNLTKLSLTGKEGEDKLLCGLLDGDSQIQLPLLRTLNITTEGQSDRRSKVSCKAGHSSLVRLNLNSRSGSLAISTITLTKLPCLRKAFLRILSPSVNLILDLPENCGIYLTNSYSFFTSERVSNCHMYYDAARTKWVEITLLAGPKKRKGES